MAVARVLSELGTELSDDPVLLRQCLLLLGQLFVQLEDQLLQANQAFEQIWGLVFHGPSVPAVDLASYRFSSQDPGGRPLWLSRNGDSQGSAARLKRPPGQALDATLNGYGHPARVVCRKANPDTVAL